MTWETLSKKAIVSKPWISVYENKVKLPNGLIVDDYYSIRVHDSVSVVATTNKDEIVLIKQYRYCYDNDLYELPSGIIDVEEEPLIAAKRELMEETGFTSSNWEYLGDGIENPAKMTNVNYLFWAKDCIKNGHQSLDMTENIETIVLPFEDGVNMTMNNEIKCYGSACGILKVARIRAAMM